MYTSQIRSTHEQLIELERHNARLVGELSETRTNEKKYFEKSKENEEKLEIAEQNLYNETKAHTESKKLLREANDEIQKLRELNDDLLKEKTRNESTIRKYNEQITSKEEMLVNTNQKLYSAQNDKSDLNAQLIDAQRQIEILQSSIRSLTLIEQEYSKVKHSISEMEVERERALIDLKSRCDEDKLHSEKIMNEKMSHEKEKFSQLSEEHDRLKNKVKLQDSSLNKLNEKVQTLDKTCTDLRNENESKSITNSQLQSKIREMEENLVKAAERMSVAQLNHKKEIDGFQFKVDSKETQIAQLEKEVRQLQLESVKLKEQQDKNLYTIESRITQELKSIINELKR